MKRMRLRGRSEGARRRGLRTSDIRWRFTPRAGSGATASARTRPGLAAIDQRALEHALGGVQAVEAARQQPVDDAGTVASVVLPDSSIHATSSRRTAGSPRRADDSITPVSSTESPARCATSARVRRRRAGRVSGSRPPPGVGPRRSFVQEVRACEREQRHRRIVRPRPRYSTRSRKVGSAQWTSSKITTAGAPRKRLEGAPHGPGGVARGGGRLVIADECGDAIHDVLLEAARAGQHVSQGVDQREERRAVAVRTQRPTSTRASSSDSAKPARSASCRSRRSR